MEQNTKNCFKNKFYAKIIALILTLLIIFFAIPSIVYAEAADALANIGEEDETATLAEETQDTENSIPDIYEIKELREENVKHFRLSDGSTVAAVYPTAVHIADGEGGWTDIDNTLYSVSTNAVSGDGRIKISKKITGNANLFTLHLGNKKISLGLIGANKGTVGEITNFSDLENETELQKMLNLEKLNSSVIYRDILFGVDLEYIIQASSIKENIIIKKRTDSYSYSFELSLNGLVANMCEDGSIALADNDGTVHYRIPAPVLFDSSDSYGNAAYTLSENGGNGKYILTVTADSEWINSEERVFPVTLDPAICPSQNTTLSTYVDRTSSVSPFLNNRIYVSSTQTAYWKTNSISFIPASSYISKAVLTVRSNGTSNAYVGAHRVTTDWDETLTYQDTQLSSPQGGLSGDLLSYTYANGASGTYFDFDVTEAVKYWVDNPSLNYGVALKYIQGNSSCFYSASASSSSSKPCLKVSYVNHNGIESYNSYSTHNVAAIASGNVNLATGSLVLDVPVLTATNSLLPYTLSLTYDGARANTALTRSSYNVPYDTAIAALGFKWSMQQSLLKRTYNDEEGNSKNLYIWCDADGSEHSFFQLSTSSYADNDGLGLTLTENTSSITIASKDKTVYTFSKASSGLTGILSSISDKNGNKIVFEYSSGSYVPISIKFVPYGKDGFELFRFVYHSSGYAVPKAVYDVMTGRGVLFTYSNTATGSTGPTCTKYLRQVDYVTGSASWTESDWSSLTSVSAIATLKLAYDENGRIISARDDISDEGIKYTYNGSKVETVYQSDMVSSGQKIKYIYGVGYTEVRSSGRDDVFENSDDLITKNIFDNYGRATSAYSYRSDGTRIYSGVLGEYETQENVKNNLKEVVDVGEGSVNYLVNGGFEHGGGFENWTKSASGVYLSAAYDEPHSINKIKLAPAASTTAYVYQIVSLEIDTYTVSLDITSGYASGLTVGLKITNLSNTSDVKNILLSKNENLNDQNQGNFIKRVSESFTTTATAKYKIEIYATANSTSTSASVQLDNVMLTEGKGMAAYNMVDFGGIDSYACNSSQVLLSPTQKWTLASNVSISSNSVFSGSAIYMNSERIIYDNTATQRIYSNDSPETTIPERSFLVSAYAKGLDAAVSENAKFDIKIKVGYYSSDPEEFTFDFIPQCDSWQFVVGKFSTKAYSKILYIDVICEFSGQVNAIAYFDNISVVDVTDYNQQKYTYYANGNLKTVSSFSETEYYRYDSEDRLIAKGDSNGLLYEYAYDAKGNLTSEILYHYYLNEYGDGGFVKYPIEDENGNAISNPDFFITKSKLTETVYTVNSYGLVTQDNTYAYTPSGLYEATTVKNIYAYELTSGVFFGARKTYMDTLGNVTRYYYQITDTGIVSAYANQATGYGSAVFTDIWGNLEKVLPVISASSSSYTTETNAEYVKYTYNVKNELTNIYTDSTNYKLNYDSYGNQKSVVAGGNTLAVYTYNANNGKLNKVTYGNGLAIEYVYDELENISEIWYNVSGTSTIAYRYSYTESGLLHKVEDVKNSKTTVYNYDKNDRLVFASEYSTADMATDFTVNYDYDEFGNILHIDYMLAYKSAGAFYDKHVYNSHYYDDYRRLSEERVNFDGSLNASTHYTYDSFQRLSQARLTYNGTFELSTSYGFSEYSNQTSAQVQTYTNTVNGTVTAYSYTYDTRGNITSVSIGGVQKYRYQYDNLGQLIREDNIPDNKTYVYIYDNSGNITSKKAYSLTAPGATPSGSYTATSYVYSTGTWGDLLTSYKGGSITYDTIGNPTSYYDGKTFSWEGRRLVGAVSGSKTMSFKYNDEGIRTSKTVNGVTTNYYLEGSRIIAEETNGNITVYLYNSTGIIGFQYHASSYGANVWDTYFYEKNLQGDIVAVYTSTGVKKISYAYDAWGKTTTTYYNGATASNLKNPFTYRGYYYDNDLGFYYLNSRYYDSNTGRFISADGQLNTSTMLGYNLFAYCENNPVMFVDPNGDFFGIGALLSGGVGIIFGIVALFAAFQFTAEVVSDIIETSTEAISETVKSIQDIIQAKDDSKAEEKEKVDTVPPDTNWKTYYHITTPEAAASIMASGKMYGSEFEGGYVFAWKLRPNKYAIEHSGAHYGILISFESQAVFYNDLGIEDSALLKFLPVMASGPIYVRNVKILE